MNPDEIKLAVFLIEMRAQLQKELLALRLASHTPGPWTAKLDRFDFTNAGERYVVYGDPATDRYGSVAFVRPMLERQERGKNKTPYNAPDAERDSNARLIAAAPDLLAVCETIASGKGGYMPELRAAIAKAKGTKSDL